MIVYLITNRINNKKYVGQTKQIFRTRWSGHKTAARCPKSSSHNTPLARAIRKYGEDAFVSEVLFTCNNKKTLDLYEMGHIKFFDTRRKGYNCTDGGEGMHGYPCSEAHKQKLRELRLGTHPSAETRQRISQASLGRIASPEKVEKCRQCQLGRKASPELRKKLSEADKAKPHQTHCRRGHEYTPENTHIRYSRKGLARLCKICMRDNVEKNRDKLNAYSKLWNRKAAARKSKRIGPLAADGSFLSQQARESRPVALYKMARKSAPPKPPRTHCIHGHEHTPENVYSNIVNGVLQTRCKICLKLGCAIRKPIGPRTKHGSFLSRGACYKKHRLAVVLAASQQAINSIGML